MILADITMSLDGFVTGPDPGPGNGLGDGGRPLHAWAFDADSEIDRRVLGDAVERTGAVIMGRRTFDVVDAPSGWDDEVGYGAGHAASPPAFVLTHRAPDAVRLVSRFSFVTEGLQVACEQARAAAGDRHVVVMGGADIVRQAVDLGLLDELRIHLAPLLLGSGTRLFPHAAPRHLVQRSIEFSPRATHLVYGLRAA